MMFDFIESFWPILLFALLIGMGIVLRKKNSFFYWSARIVAILDILFLAWSSYMVGGDNLGDFISENLLTSFPMLIVLVFAWKYDLVGAIGFGLVGAFFLVYFEWGDFPIGVVPIFIGILFALSWLKKQKRAGANGMR